MTKTELDTTMTMVYGNLGHIKDVTNITIDDFKDEIVCTVSGKTEKIPMLSQITLAFDRKEGC